MLKLLVYLGTYTGVPQEATFGDTSSDNMKDGYCVGNWSEFMELTHSKF